MNSNSPAAPAAAANGRLGRPQNRQQDNLDSECQERRRPNVDFARKMDNFRKSQTLTFTLKPARRKSSTTILLEIFTLIVLNSLLTQITYITNRVNHHYHLDRTSQQRTSYPPQSFLSSAIARANLPTIILAAAAVSECQSDDDCGREKVCHDNKCICTREKPIELDQDRCLPRTLIDEQCVIDEQCMGDANCIDGICSCGNEAISLFNPSAKISYCHPKRSLNEQCNHDLQCPSNAYCSTKKSGCLCHNGYAEAVVNNEGKESRECLSKFCTSSTTCESKFHECDDNKCKCLAAHFDPTTAKCYEYGSTGGLTSDATPANNGTGREVLGKTNDTTIYTFIKDLMENGDKIWLVLLILITLSIIVFVLIFILVKKYYAGICWTTHKKEYQPNNKNAPKNGYFNKNSINNKSFRQKSGEPDDEDNDETAADRSNLVSDSNNKSNETNGKTGNQYVRIDMNDKRDEDHHYGSPLSTSTSTPV